MTTIAELRKQRKPKIYLALSVYIHNLPSEHWKPNGGRQYTVVCKTTSVKKLSELLETTESNLRNMGVMVSDNEKHAEICQKENTVYYEVERGSNSYGGKWFGYIPKP